jgi:hypothetical protein
LVYCNDPRRQQFSLVMLGTVERFASIEPNFAKLFGRAGADIHATIRIIPEDRYRFRILGPMEKQTNNVHYLLSRLDNPGRQGYLLTVKNVRKEKGRYFEQIVLKTDSPIKPQIKIKIYGNVTE